MRTMTKDKQRWLLMPVLLGCLLLVGQTEAATVYGHGNHDDTLYRIDTGTQTVSLVGANPSRFGPEIQMNANGSTIFMSGTSSDLHFIDPATGLTNSTIALSNLPPPTNRATAMEMVGSTLYASFHTAGPEVDPGVLGTINTTTGAFTTIGTMTGMNRPAGGLSFANGVMYSVTATDQNDGALFSVNLANGISTQIASLTLGAVQQEAATALAFADNRVAGD